MKRKTVYTLLIIICIVGFWVFENFYTPAVYSDTHEETTDVIVPLEFLPQSTTGAVVNHQYYMLSYSERYEQAEWVAYPLKKAHLTKDDRKRPYFEEDPHVKTKSADWRNYKRSGYDRGHLCPAGDRRFSEQAYNETFYTSNIAPQNREFNAGIWNRLEQRVRYWCKSYGDLYVITGGILEDGLEGIGDEDVAVPKQFYKLVFRETKKGISVLAFLLPNEERQAPLSDFLISVDDLEQLSGLDFFHTIDPSIEQSIEATVDISGWRF